MERGASWRSCRCCSGAGGCTGRGCRFRVREAIMTALMRIGDAASVRALLPHLQDAGLRAAAIEALQAMPEAILPFMTSLFADGDSDVRLLATELARNMPAADATHLLCSLLEHEQHPNVCAAAVEVLAEVGREAIPRLRRAPDVCWNSVPAICRVDSHRPDFGHGKLGFGWLGQRLTNPVPYT